MREMILHEIEIVLTTVFEKWNLWIKWRLHKEKSDKI